MSNVGDGGAGPNIENIEIKEADEERLLDIVSLGEKIFLNSWNEQMVATSMYGTYDTVLTAIDTSKNNRLAGYCIFTAPCEDCELLRIAVDKDYRRKGIGSELIKTMIRMCAKNNGENIFLEVRQSNEAAIGLYEAMGFDEISRRRDYYKKPTEDAVIMELKDINE